ncbi:MAG: tetratricopeptide repeat protein [Rivularia sp. T60_A2020_040]|nr:tetratricopeptide repeat protein [Rivularia sp. T60_A2020_040]
MYPQKLRLITLLTLVATLSGAAVPNLPVAFTASRVLAQTVDGRKAEAYRLLQQGIHQLQTSQNEAGLQSLRQALIIYQEIKDRQGERWALGNISIAYRNLGNYSKAIDYSKQSLTIAREIKDRRGEAKALGNLSIAYLEFGNYYKTIDYSKQLLTIAREIEDRQDEAKALGNLGLAYLNLGDYTKAISYFHQDLSITREIKDRNNEGKALGNLGTAYFLLGDYPKAIDYFKQRLAIAREIKYRQGEVLALGNIGLAYLNLQKYVKAIDYSKQLLPIAKEIKDRQGEGAALGNIGIAYQNLGDYAKAIDYQQQSLAIAREIKYPLDEGKSLNNIGSIYLDLGDYAKAIHYFEQRLAIAREIKDRQGEAKALGNLGIAHLRLGDYPKATDYFEQNLAIAKKIKDRKGESAALGNLGTAYFELGDYAKAIDYSEQLLAIARKIKDRDSEGRALGNLGAVYSNLGNYIKGIDYLKQDLAIAREIKDPNSESKSLSNLGYTFYKSGKLSAAETSLFEAVKVLESLRGGLKDENKISIFEEQSRTYRILQQVLIAQNKTDTALEIAERGRARAFVELLASRLNLQEKPQAPTIEQIKQIAKAQNATLVQYSRIGDNFKVAGKVQAKESELYIWIVKPTGEVTFRKADLKPLWQKENTDLAELIITSRESIGARGRGIDVSYNPDAGKAQNNLKRLHKLLIKPIADVLPKKDSARVIFIPQSSLFLVPFPALRDENGKYLIEKHTILTSPSIQVLNLTRKQKQRIGNKPIEPNNALIIGNPTMPFVPPKIGEPPQQLSPLPGAEREAKAIGQLFKTQPLIGNQATETEVTKRLPQARLIHLATHGIFDDTQGLNSSIALAPSSNNKGNEKGDGLLSAGEILDLKLNAELVVLSACDTGRGRISGDGVIGLSRSLISAGVPSVLVSLWSVPDARTAELMTEFYQNLQNNPDKAQALRQAMLTTMKQHPAPRDWAAFTLIGEAD